MPDIKRILDKNSKKKKALFYSFIFYIEVMM